MPVTIDADGGLPGVDPTMEELLTATADGSRSAFAALYRRTYDRVVGLAVSIVRDHDLAEDIAQETLAEIWSRAGRFRPELGAAVPWILNLTRCRAIDRIRSEESDRGRLVAVGSHALVDGREPIEERLETQERVRALQTALQRLSALQREAIQVTHLEGRTFREAAAALGVPVGTLKTRAHDGIVRLRELLEAPLPEIRTLSDHGAHDVPDSRALASAA